MSQFQDIEAVVKEVLRAQFSETVYNLWFKDLTLTEMTDTKATLTMPSDFKTNFLNGRHQATLQNAFKEACGFSLEIEVISTQDGPYALTLIREQQKAEEEKKRKEEEAKKEQIGVVTETPLEDVPGLDSRTIHTEFTFDNFIVGESNKFAHAASLAVAKNPTTYNPLFIHGPSGLGKTHLLYAIANKMREADPNIRLIYKKGEEFTNELIESIQNGTTMAFREKYRKADVLLVDDIQFIAGRESTQEEFFHTFNALYETEKQIILTSDKPPHSIRTLEDRLRTRFEWGLIADIQPPSSELRQAIIRKKAEVRGIKLSDDIVLYLAENLKTNIRQIEGSIKKIAALSSLTHTPISLDISKRAIADILSGEEPVSITVDKICAVVSKKYDIPAEEIKGKKRNKEIAKARHVSIYLIKHLTSLPLTSIGALMGNRDHATILFSFNKIKDDMKTDKQLAAEIADMIEDIQK